MTNPVTPESANSFVAFFADDRTLEARDRTPEAERLEEFPYLDHSLIELESALPGNSPRAVGPRVLVRQGGEFECQGIATLAVPHATPVGPELGLELTEPLLHVSVRVSDHEPSLPDGARHLLLGPIDSFEKLEVVIALCASGNAPLSLAALEARTGAPSSVLKTALEQLTTAGVVAARGGNWRLAPECDGPAIDDLVRAWSSSRTVVLDVMTQRSLERIRASTARRFADAFKLRPEKRDPGGEDG